MNKRSVFAVLLAMPVCAAAQTRGASHDSFVQITNDVTHVVAGTRVTYMISLFNSGANSAGNPAHSLPPELADATWECAGSGGASCNPTSGDGNIDNSVQMPGGGIVTYLLTASVVGPPGGSVVHTVRLSTLGDVDDSNNQASDTDPIIADVLFAAGFE